MTYAGAKILRLPDRHAGNDRARDIEIIKKELPGVDILEFFYLTPLPGSEDHKNCTCEGHPDDST